MRRLVVPLALFLAATAVWGMGIAGPATATPTAPRIVCPLTTARLMCCTPPQNMPARAYRTDASVPPICCQTGPCCDPLPSDVCCAPPLCGVGGLTIVAAPNPSTAGRKVVISGSMLGSPAAGAQVVLWRELADQSAFLQIAHTTTNAAGAYTFTLVGGAVMTDQEWYVTSNGMRSATVQQQVHALVGLASSAHSAAAIGQAIVLSGRVTPSHAGEIVLIEQRRGAAWHVIARPRLGRHSMYAASHRFATTGTVKLRTVLRGDARNARSVSRTVTITVNP